MRRARIIQIGHVTEDGQAFGWKFATTGRSVAPSLEFDADNRPYRFSGYTIDDLRAIVAGDTPEAYAGQEIADLT